MKKENSLWTKNFILITIVNFLIYGSFQLFPSALPPYVKSIGGGESVLGWLTGITTIATLIIRPFAGMILDRRGKKGIFTLGLIIMTICSILYKFFPIISIILLIRFIHGIGWGVASTASNTIATDNIVKNRFGEGMGYFSLSISLALAIAPALSLRYNIDIIFNIGIVLLIASFIVLFFIKEDSEDKKQIDLERSKEISSPYEKASILPSILIFLITTTYGGIVTFLAIYGQSRGINNIGIFFSVYAGIMLISRPILGKLIDRIGYRLINNISFILVVIGLVILGKANSIIYIIISAMIYGIGYGGLQTSLQTMAVIKAPKNRSGAANATYYTGFDGGIGFGSIISGLLVSRFGYENMFLILGIFPILAIIIYNIYNNKKIDS